MSQTCSRCGAEIPEGHAICPTCGAGVPKPQRYVRCSHCLHRAPAGLTVCPHCGRTLRPWRADKWVLSLSLLALAGLWLIFGNGFAVVSRAGDALEALLPPAITPAAVVAAAPTATATTLALPTNTAVAAASPTLLPTEAPTATPHDTVTPTASPAPTSTVATDTAVSTASPTPKPTDTATPEPTATATVTPSPTPKPQSDVVVVQAGDTLSGIAQKVNRSVAALAAYNQITDPTTIRVGQELKIPPADYVPPTPTPKRPTKTPTPTPTATPSISLPAPVLINPGNESTFSGQKALIELKWQSLPTGLPPGAEYVVHIGVLVGPNDISWRMTEPVGSQTSFYVPEWLFGQAPQDYGRAYVWYIQAAMVTHNGDQVTTIPISQPSETRKFYWN